MAICAECDAVRPSVVFPADDTVCLYWKVSQCEFLSSLFCGNFFFRVPSDILSVSALFHIITSSSTEQANRLFIRQDDSKSDRVTVLFEALFVFNLTA